MKRINQKKIVLAGVVLLLLSAAGVAAAFMIEKPRPAAAADSLAGVPSQRTAPAGGLAAADKNGDGIVYQSGMHPWIVQDEPGKCPICGMDMVPVNVADVEAGTVKVDPATLQNMGVRTALVAVEPMARTVRTTGRFEANEQLMTAVSPKIGGWVETLHVNYEGARVAKGQPLLEIYSPELVSTQEEYLLALRNLERLGGTQAEEDARRLVDAARRRLAYWDISETQIQRLMESGVPQKTVTLHAPASGTVVATSVTQGQKVMAGQTLMRLSNLSTLWLMADVYEQDLSWVGVGTRAAIALPYDPAAQLSGTVDYLYDQLSSDTRTVKARISVSNPGLKLKPGMYATVTLLGRETEPIPTVPSEAVVRTGERSVVILSLGNGRFMPAEVRAGVEANGKTQILNGLQGGETVVTSAQFLIDSEARLASAVGAMVSDHSTH